MKPTTSIAQGNSVIALQYVKFCVVGGSGVVVDMLVLHCLVSPSWLNWNLTLSKVIAAEVAILSNFILNDVWTFRELAEEGISPSDSLNRPNHSSPHPSPFRGERGRSDWHARLARFGKFNLICTAGIALSVALLNAQVYVLGVNVYLANFIAIVVVSFWNFFLNRRFGWNRAVQPRIDKD